MDTFVHPRGLAISVDQDAVVIRVERQLASPMLSILLHSKFSDGPRMDFLTTPYTNKLIEAFMVAASWTNMDQRGNMTQSLAHVIQYAEEWAKQQSLSAEETASLMKLALYPYEAT